MTGKDPSDRSESRLTVALSEMTNFGESHVEVACSFTLQHVEE
jgi:hypothetical protein